MKVIVVGAGFSGLMTTIHLLRDPSIEVVLVEKAPMFGTGAAYSTTDPEHLLNVRAGNMSAFPDDPGHLLAWLRRRGRPADPGTFLTRGEYGRYLRSLLDDLAADATVGPRLRRVGGEVTDLVRDDGWRASVAGYGEVFGDAVVLALGNLEPRTPEPFMSLTGSETYIADPWRAAADLPPSARRILLLGSGLTMVDVALALRAPGRRLTTLSRRGLLPRAHADLPAETGPLALAGGPHELLRQVRRLSDTLDWRSVMDQARLQVRTVWRSWSREQRASALRHLRPYWDVHRHRLAPRIAGLIGDMQAAGELETAAGRVVSAETHDGKVHVRWRPRGSSELRDLEVDAVVNCTGPLTDVRASGQPLLKNLLARGRAVADPLGLGLSVDEEHRLLDARGSPVDGLFAVGPLTRGASWEMTAVPDLRRQAAEAGASVRGWRAGPDRAADVP